MRGSFQRPVILKLFWFAPENSPKFGSRDAIKSCFDLAKLSLILELSVPDQIYANKKSFRVRVKKKSTCEDLLESQNVSKLIDFSRN